MVKAAPTSALAQYGSYELDAASEEREQLDQTGGGAFLKLESGRNVLRFLPPPIGKRSPFLMTYQHFIKLPGMANPFSPNCPRMMAKQNCPVCRKVDELRGTGSKVDYDLAGGMLAKPRIYSNVINRKEPEVGPQVFPFGKKIHEQLVALRQDVDAGGDFTHPVEGFDIVIEKSGENLTTTYKVMPSRTTSDLGDVEWIAQQADLDRFALVESAEEIAEEMQKRMGGMSGGGPRGRAPAAAPAAAARTRGPAPRTGQGYSNAQPAQHAAAGRPVGRRGRSAEDDMNTVQGDDPDHGE